MNELRDHSNSSIDQLHNSAFIVRLPFASAQCVRVYVFFFLPDCCCFILLHYSKLFGFFQLYKTLFNADNKTMKKIRIHAGRKQNPLAVAKIPPESA